MKKKSLSLRKKALGKKKSKTKKSPQLDELEIISRYGKQIAFKEMSLDEQKKLLSSKVAIVGLGGIGSVAAQLLVRAGIGNLILIDRDIVELSNLQRQFFSEKDIGLPKAVAAKKILKQANSRCKTKEFVVNLDRENIESILKEADLVLDCTDNFETRFLLNDFCLKARKPWVHAAATASTVVVWPIDAPFNINGVSKSDSPCLRCLYKDAAAGTIESCETAGILGEATAAAAAFQVAAALKLILNKSSVNKLLYFDVWTGKFEAVQIGKDKNCPACSGNYEWLYGKKSTDIVSLCGSNTFQIKNSAIDFESLKKNLRAAAKKQVIKNFAFDAHTIQAEIDNFKVTIFKDGRALIKNVSSAEQAKAVWARVAGA